MKIIGSFLEADIIELDKKQTIYLMKKDNMKKAFNKHKYYKVFLTINDVKELYEHLRRNGLC